MKLGTALTRLASLATLRETRHRLRVRGGAWLVGGIAASYAFLSMLVGQMLIFVTIRGDFFVTVYWGGNGTHPWDYPALLAQQPWGILALPFFPTIAMLLVSIGVGVGAAVGVILIIQLLRRRRGAATRSAATGAAAGVGPAITGLATLGACCCTGCASAGAITLVAAASGTTLNQLLLNDWYIGVFQIAVVYVALLAQERTLRLTADYCPVPPPVNLRFVLGAVLRVGLLIAGITWSLAMFIEWGDVSPLTAPAATWYHWLFEHQLLSLTAIAAGLFPKEFAGLVRSVGRSTKGRVGRVAFAVAGVSWGIWVPPALAGIGLGGFLNELFGFTGFPIAWGAIPPDAVLGPPLYFHWAFQHLLLSGFALGIALAPTGATAPLLWTVAPSLPGPVGDGDSPPSGPDRRSPGVSAPIVPQVRADAESTAGSGSASSG